MKRHEQSRTSELIAVYRAIHAAQHEAPILVDPFAHKLVRPWWRLAARSRLLYALYRAAGIRLDPGIALCMARSRIAEDRLDTLLRNGTPTQWVLLGAGLDMFAWRRPEHADVPQFEVDHPATQADKRRKLAALGLTPPTRHRFVPVNFEEESASTKLGAAGFDPTVPAVFAWLGVTYYLTREAITATLRDLRSIAAPGSHLVFDYRAPDRHARPDELRLLALGDRTFAKWGEPFVSLVEPDEWRTLARETGWRHVADHDHQAMVERFYKGRTDGLRPTTTYRVVELASD